MTVTTAVRRPSRSRWTSAPSSAGGAARRNCIDTSTVTASDPGGRWATTINHPAASASVMRAGPDTTAPGRKSCGRMLRLATSRDSSSDSTVTNEPDPSSSVDARGRDPVPSLGTLRDSNHD